MNKAKLTALCHRVAKDKGLTFNSVMVYYFLEEILKQLSRSNYKDNYIFKGGFLLSNVIGIQSRSTIDIDFLFHQQVLTEDAVRNQLTDILENIANGDLTFKVQGIQPIKESDDYGGFRASILCQLENIKQVVHLDIATGDVITPQPVLYDYQPIFEENHFSILAYNIETIIAEKLQTLYSRSFLNSRSKDFYDLYILSKLKSNEINYSDCLSACQRTFDYRATEFDLEKIYDLLTKFRNDEQLDKQWANYSKRYNYTHNISF